MKKFILMSIVCVVAIILPYKTSEAYNDVYITTYNGENYYVSEDRVDVSDVDPENIFELYLGVTRADGRGKSMVYRLRFYRENSIWYYRMDWWGNLPIKGTIYETIFNFCRARYF